MSDSHDQKVAAVVSASRKVPEENFVAYGGGWQREISTALLDAVFSVRAVYRSDKPGVGVSGRLDTFRRTHSTTTDDLKQLAALGAPEIQRIMGGAKTAQRLKSEVVVEAARKFCDESVRTADDFRGADIGDMKTIYTSVRGLGWVTFEYFAMHLGIPGVKADRMIVRFVNRALDDKSLDPVRDSEARALVAAAYKETGLGETLMHFDHAIWRFESDSAAGR